MSDNVVCLLVISPTPRTQNKPDSAGKCDDRKRKPLDCVSQVTPFSEFFTRNRYRLAGLTLWNLGVQQQGKGQNVTLDPVIDIRKIESIQ
jgi:hypothetical protein